MSRHNRERRRNRHQGGRGIGGRSPIFHDFTIQFGRIYSRRTHDGTTLVPEAVGVFDTMLGGLPDFRSPVPYPGGFDLHVTQECDGAALATFYARDELATTSALLSGSDADADAQALEAICDLSNHVFAKIGVATSGDMLTIAERPALVTVVWPNPAVDPNQFMTIADMETCLAAAYFKYWSPARAARDPRDN